MVRLFCSVILIMSLTGCSMFGKVFTKVETVYVDVPVSSCVATDIPEKPMLNIFDLTVGSTDEHVAKSYVNSIKVLQTHVLKLEELLKAYK